MATSSLSNRSTEISAPTTVTSASLPPHANILANADVWMEGAGVTQFAKVASLPGCVRAVGMPDLHLGKGPVGAVFATRDFVYPHLLGGDVGCGVRIVATTEDAKNRDAIERRLEKSWEEDLFDGASPDALLEAAFRQGLSGFANVEGLPESLSALAKSFAVPRDDIGVGALQKEGLGLGEALGTVGGGNHFAEIARVDEVRDRALASKLGLHRGCLVALAHSGSRALGSVLARHYGDATLTRDTWEPYLADVRGTCRFAEVNRFLLACRLLKTLGAARSTKIAGSFDVVHNDVREEPVDGTPTWVHRKGAAPAYPGEPTIVLGSRGAPSWVLVGTSSDQSLHSVAHGAGRRMGRSEALSKLKAKYRRAELIRTKLGGSVLCDDPDLLYEEHPDAYKPIDPVVKSLVDAGVATQVASLVPVITIKR